LYCHPRNCQADWGWQYNCHPNISREDRGWQYNCHPNIAIWREAA
jgi:hypothetical protein